MMTLVLSQLFPFGSFVKHLCSTCMIIAAKKNKNEDESSNNLVSLKPPPNLSL